MMRILVALAMAFSLVTSTNAQTSLGLGIRQSGVSIGITFSSYPDLVPVPGYPVYYDPRADSNYFFYDGLYWVYEQDNWYASSWYNGPWDLVDPFYVPAFVLRVPVRYYRRPPVYFRGWRADAPPRWDEHWGRDWNTRRSGWDKWDPKSAPHLAPLPSYQSQYSGSRYPRAPDQQRSIRSGQYQYEPHESLTRQYWQRQQTQSPRVQQQPQRQTAPTTQQQAQLPQAQPQSQQHSQLQPELQPRRQQPEPPQQPQQQRQHPNPEPRTRGRESAPEAQDQKGQQKDGGPGEKGRDDKIKERDRNQR